RVAEREVQAHREDGEDQHLGEEVHLIARGGERQQGERRHRRDAPRDHRAPKMPVGRTARIRAMGAKIVNMASSGKRALPKVSSRPTSSAPTKAPLRLPSPPMMTTTKATSRISKSEPGDPPSMGTRVTA